MRPGDTLSTQTAPAQSPATQPSSVQPDSQAATVIILTLLAAGLVPPPLMLTGAAVLAGVPVAALTAAFALAAAVPSPTMPPGVAARGVMAGNAAYRAAFVVAASRRLATGGGLDAERQNLRAHLTACKARTGAAMQVDQAANVHGMVLGWRAVGDSRTDATCASLSGGNFVVGRPPLGLYPGQRDAGNCRCVAVAPFPGGRLLG